MHCVTHVEAPVIRGEEGRKRCLKCIPVSLGVEHSETQSPGQRSPVVATSNYIPSPSTSLASIPTWNGPSSPISTLLEELLIIIFDDVITSESSTSQRLNSPRNLASVSRAWRTIVFSCPLLWKHVHLTPVQPLDTLKEQLRLSAPLPIHLTVHQWPFRNPILASGPFSVSALTAQLQSILLPTDSADVTLPASQRVESISINATESSTFPNFVLQTWTGRGSKFPALRRVSMDGNVCATWSRACFFDGRNAPKLERLELTNVVIAYDAFRFPWGIGQNLTTLIWAAPPHKHGSLMVSAACFHHVVSSFPNLATLELRGHVIALEYATLENMQASGVTPLRHVRNLVVSGRVFANASAAFILFCLLPSLRRLAVRGMAYSGPFGLRTVTLALQALMCLPKVFGRPMVLPNLEDLELECVDGDECDEWKTWCMGEFELWRQLREALVDRDADTRRLQMRLVMNAVDE